MSKTVSRPSKRPRRNDTSTPTPGPRHFAIIGAGMAGIACARTLVQAGHRVTVFEQVLMQHALTAETIFLNSTTFRRNETDRLNGHLFFIPGEELRGLISQRLKRS